ncbi:nucleic-acid-binding protein from transposon X-element [Trichonephila inaurata madagascariensis]|uniref:Nucleic-acid-binding protein from transposon X-element n=1 Tax=Trichonephila inaurata madagascariensis TaxID=2747483 RepID=A0A8X6YWQ3_9ARAC|nr:nucleic-acid-binding protein from transposon X-element [Trichonephila inaurata madagascariensis]
MNTRCLKCGQPHKTSDCPIKEKIDNPQCINCNERGHLANSHHCVKFPKLKPKKGDPSQDRHKNSSQNILSSAKVQENISYANTLKGNHKMAPPPEQTRSKSNETPLGENRQATSEAESESFGFMDAILELKKFFTDYPSLLELGKKLRQAQGDERLDVFYRHLISI